MVDGMESTTIDFGDGNGEVAVYYKRRNLDQMDKVLQAQDKGHVEMLVTTLQTRCLTEHGSLMFSEADKRRIRKDFDPIAVIKMNNILREFDAKAEGEMSGK